MTDRYHLLVATTHPKTRGRPLAKRRAGKSGFALIVTLLILVLLVTIALGLLNLSTITLRQSDANAKMASARANAKLALTLAIGELQKYAGSDKAVTATSELLSDAPAKGNLTGVWSSWDYLGEIPDPANAAPDYPGRKTQHFLKWLVSDANSTASGALLYPTTPFQGETIELVGSKSLGGTAADNQKAKAGRIPLMRDGKPAGAYAWHIADESVKARIASYRNPALNSTLAQKRALLSGHRPDVSVVKAVDGTALDFLPKDDDAKSFEVAQASTGRLLDIDQMGVLSNAPSRVGRFRNDVTPYSMGLLTDVRRGGLKRDLSAMFEAVTLPTEYAGKKLYASMGGVTAPSDPNWSALADYYQMYRDVGSSESLPGLPSYRVAPKEKIDINAPEFTLEAPVGFSAVPVIAKVEFLFSLVVRDEVPARVAGMPYMMHLLCTPLVTLHNPYNVALEFDRMQVVIRNVPLGFRFYVNNLPLSTDLGRLGFMHVPLPGGATRQGEKSFALDISNWSNPTSSGEPGLLIMKPGQSLVCGPYVDPKLIFTQNAANPLFDNGNTAGGVDFNGKIVGAVKSKPGFIGKGVGYDCDYLVPTTRIANVHTGGSTPGPIKLKLPEDTLHCEFGLIKPAAVTANSQNDRLKVYATIQGTQYGGLSFVYSDQLTLDRHFGQMLRFPATGEKAAADFYEPNTKPMSEQVKAQTIGVLSAYARTSNGGVYETLKRQPGTGANTLLNGRLAGQPFLFHNPALAVEQVDMKYDFPGNFSRELNFQPLPGEIDDLFNLNGDRCSILTGNTSVTGIKSGASFELPSGPMKSIADFRRSNALTTPFQPNFVQPVSNSMASPQLATSALSASGTSYPLLDHSVLANNALYDGFYFSTVAPDGNVVAEKVFRDFMAGNRALANQNYRPWLPKGETVDSLVGKCFAGTSPSTASYQQFGRCQMVAGPFNVNSTRVEAWKAMLSSMSRSEVNVLWAASGLSKIQKPVNAPIMAMSLPVGGSTSRSFTAADIDDKRTNDWNGYRELTPAQIETLARCIVDQVRERGPFLSLSEFVNRRLGGDSKLTRSGALQVAIKNSGINQDATFLGQVLFGASDFDGTDNTGAPLFKYKTPPAPGDNPAAGAPGWITQGDLMHLLEPAATVRSDTFVIRSYGEATDQNGKVVARAYAEAVVQRIPEFVDPIDESSVNVFQSGASKSLVNPIFGRRLEIVSFRWLSPSEI